MRDMGNLGDGGEPFELRVSSLSELIPREDTDVEHR